METDGVRRPGGQRRGRRTEDWEAEIGRQVLALRHRTGLTQRGLARRANVGVSTVKRLESGEGGTLRSFIDVLRAMDREDWLDTLAPPPPTVDPMQMLRDRQAAEDRRRQRVRPPRSLSR